MEYMLVPFLPQCSVIVDEMSAAVMARGFDKKYAANQLCGGSDEGSGLVYNSCSCRTAVLESLFLRKGGDVLIKLNHVSFSYQNGEANEMQVLSDVSFQASRGECVVLCGKKRMWEDDHASPGKRSYPSFLCRETGGECPL